MRLGSLFLAYQAFPTAANRFDEENGISSL
jgi:hypothetical protein